MLLFKILFIIVLSGGLQAEDELENNEIPDRFKIVGGQPAANGAYPFMAILRIGNGGLCGGTIISPRFILTAAHCIKSSAITVVVGTNYQTSGGTRYAVSQIIKHKRYNTITHINDIALLKVNKNIQMTNTVKAVVLRNCLNDNYVYPVTAVGWGTTSTNSASSNTLRYVNLNTRTQTQCKSIWRYFTANQICTSYPSKGVCFGDSGGPLLYGGQQIGINSYVSSRGCATNAPDVYTKVCNYLSWINLNTKLYQFELN